jgi:hypothetical protein
MYTKPYVAAASTSCLATSASGNEPDISITGIGPSLCVDMAAILKIGEFSVKKTSRGESGMLYTVLARPFYSHILFKDPDPSDNESEKPLNLGLECFAFPLSPDHVHC